MVKRRSLPGRVHAVKGTSKNVLFPRLRRQRRTPILRYDLYTAVVRAVLPCTHETMTIVGGALKALVCSFGRFWLIIMLVAIGAAGTWRSGLTAQASIERGEYIFHVAGCLTCHSTEGAPPLAGGHRFDTPFGVFISPNITPDKSHGIGAWSEQDFMRALRYGLAPDGRHYYPVFPYTSYTRMSEQDMRDLFAYLRTTEPAARPNETHELVWFARSRLGNRVWKALFLDPGAYQPDGRRSERWNRGAYIAEALAHCGECHSPRGVLGAVDGARHLSGNPQGLGGDVIPNITPHASADVSSWVAVDYAAYLSYGEMPDGDYAGGMMATVIDEGLSKLTETDRAALIEYLMTLRPLPMKGARP